MPTSGRRFVVDDTTLKCHLESSTEDLLGEWCRSLGDEELRASEEIGCLVLPCMSYLSVMNDLISNCCACGVKELVIERRKDGVMHTPR